MYNCIKKTRDSVFDGVVYDDLLFVCTLIVKTGRRLALLDSDVVEAVTMKGIKEELDLAQVTHCLPPYRIIEEFIEKYKLQKGQYYDYEFGYEGYNYPDDDYLGHMYARLIVDAWYYSKESIMSVFEQVFLKSTFPYCVHHFKTMTYVTPPQQILYEFLTGYYDKN